jgi:hypothetical protein
MNNSTTTMASMAPINVLVHGLIFMRLSAGQAYLELVIPKLIEGTNPHLFVAGVHGDLRAQNGAVDWLSIGLFGSTAQPVSQGQMPKNLKSSVPQFSISATGLDSWNNTYIGGMVLLPWPIALSSIRCDYFDRAFLYDDSNPSRRVIGDTIKQNCRGTDVNAKTGLVTCLEYTYDTSKGIDLTAVPGWKPGLNLHCCFEPLMKHKIYQVNDDLGQAAKVFRYPDNFDLRMRVDAEGIFTNPGERCQTTASGIQTDDDLSLGEGLDAGLLEQAESSLSIQSSFLVNINPANCPNFFVGP